MNALLLITCGLVLATAPAPEVLCERTAFVQKPSGDGLKTFYQLEATRNDVQRGIYGLSSVTVPPAGWEVHAVTIFTAPSSPDKWVKVQRARLNLIPKKGDLPGPDDDPRRGREVKVSVREAGKGVFAVVAPDLNLRLEPGDYWIGLTPLSEYSTHGPAAGHVLANEVRNARFDDVVRSPDGDGGALPLVRNWAPLGPRIFAVPGEHFAIKIEGRRLARGRALEWPTEAGPEVKRLHLRFATFDPVAGPPKVAEELASGPTGRLWIVQARGPVDQPFREALSRAGATPLGYLPDDAYVVALAPDGVETVRGLKVVRWVGPYHPAYRIDPDVFSEPIEAGGQKLPRKEPKGSRRVRVHDHRAALMSNSTGGRFGVPPVTHYDGYAALLDDLVLRHDLLFCSSIGNDSPGKGHAGSWAKNVLQVGGVDPRGSTRREEHSRLLCTTGPAADGRVKPDLVHFGFGVYTLYASGPRDYENFAGTSCAAPLVAGHCGLMFEAWADGAFGTRPLGRTVADRKPHAATAKALMVNSAYRYPLGKEKGQLTRYQQGWGMPDLGRLYESRKKLFVVDQEIALHDHQAVEYHLRVAEGEAELRVTLAYTDPLGMTTAAKALVNDLDLIVIAPDGQRYFGNHGLLEGNVSREGGAPDRVNNVENVFLAKPTPGTWRVVVAAHRIAWDKHQGTATWGQDFGLVASGVEPEPVPQRPESK